MKTIQSNQNQAKGDKMHALKMETARELGINLKQQGDNGHLTARQAGHIGGNMVKKLIEQSKNK